MKDNIVKKNKKETSKVPKVSGMKKARISSRSWVVPKKKVKNVDEIKNRGRKTPE
jgi:hypothetical protein